MRRSSKLAVPLKRPEDVIPHLGEASHWKQDRSAKSLADVWFVAKDVPPAVRQALDTVDVFANAEFLDGWLERETDLGDGQGGASQTDLLAILGLFDGLAILGVEAKVDETFGPLVHERMSGGSPRVVERVRSLCALLGLSPDQVGHLRYQLLHRTAAILLEAKRFRTDRAVVLIQSFCPRSTGLSDCIAFFEAIGIADFRAGALARGPRLGGVQLWAGWVSDRPLPDMSTPAALERQIA